MTGSEGMTVEGARMENFLALSREEQAQAISDLAAVGQGEHTLAHGTGLSVEQIRRVLADQEASVLAVTAPLACDIEARRGALPQMAE